MIQPGKCYLVAEMGINHNGELDIAEELIDGTVEAEPVYTVNGSIYVSTTRPCAPTARSTPPEPRPTSWGSFRPWT